ncbi:MAG TPA: kelch repeat-containing protein [Acidobacteriota bacterium]|nr:kelch repeat-containing protein [Acidobacteriota bacterium]HNH82280.1 kelch repeat-containing protein [Acidobacteriota bacterium]
MNARHFFQHLIHSVLHRGYRRQFSPWLDDELNLPARTALEAHLQHCELCRKELETLAFASRTVSQIGIPLPENDLVPVWRPVPRSDSNPIRFGWWKVATVGVAMAGLIVAWWSVGHFLHHPGSSPAVFWEVVNLEGSPAIDAHQIAQTAQFGPGQWLETDARSRAKITVGEIGSVEIDPNTRIKLVQAGQAEHRLALDEGRMHARIYAPPRVFFVDTPSAVAIDLGCAYTLEVNKDGDSTLQVTSGWVALMLNGRESLVPAGATCITKRGKGPGTPFLADASQAFRVSLNRFDFESGGTPALDTILTEARRKDGITLWHLLAHVTGAERERVYARLAELIPHPAAITRDGVLRLDQKMLDQWREQIDFAALGLVVNGSASGAITQVESLHAPRYAHSATLLKTGQVLIAGGMERMGAVQDSAELFDPRTRTFKTVGRMVSRRVNHTSTLLPNGKVLLTGGSDETFFSGALSTAELFDPLTGQFEPAGTMNFPRLAHRATLLPNGTVLITGGQTATDKLANAEIYDPISGTFTLLASSMSSPRTDHTATLLPNGKVLIVGGATGSVRREDPIATAEYFDPPSQTFSPVGVLSVPRFKHSAQLLPNGKVLILGGSNAMMWNGQYTSAELFDPSTGQFSPTGNMNTARYKIRDAVVALKNGKVLVAGASRRIELYDPNTGYFSEVKGDLGISTYYATATLLPSGEVLIAGGYSQQLEGTTSAWIYKP